VESLKNLKMNEFDWTYDIKYPEYKVGQIVSVPLNSNASCVAIINSEESTLFDISGYEVIGPNSFDPWGRWVRVDQIKETDYTCECEIGMSVRSHRGTCKHMNELFGND
jgi:hypothetical protein